MDGMTRPRWRKSSRSGSTGANCVEVSGGTTVAIRDSKLDTTGDFPYLSTSTTEWGSLLSDIRSGRLSA